MSTPLDDADAVLLRELQADARQTNRSLAKAADLAPSTTLARVRDLEEREVITGYHAEVDLTALGRGLQALVFVRLQPKSQEIINGFIDIVAVHPSTSTGHRTAAVTRRDFRSTSAEPIATTTAHCRDFRSTSAELGWGRIMPIRRPRSGHGLGLARSATQRRERSPARPRSSSPRGG